MQSLFSVYFRWCCHLSLEGDGRLGQQTAIISHGTDHWICEPKDSSRLKGLLRTYQSLMGYYVRIRTRHDFAPHVFFTINHHLRPISWLIFKREFPQHSWGKSQSLVVIAGWGSTATDTHTWKGFEPCFFECCYGLMVSVQVDSTQSICGQPLTVMLPASLALISS